MGLCFVTVFDAAWNLIKGEYPVAEFGGNTECPDCGSEMRQGVSSLGHGYPSVYGFGCDKCGHFKPHDSEYATTPKPPLICPECKGTGEQKTYNRRMESYECQMCNGTGRG